MATIEAKFGNTAKPGDRLGRGFWYVNFTIGETDLENVANERVMFEEYLRNGALLGSWKGVRVQTDAPKTGDEFHLIEVIRPTIWEWNSKHISMPRGAPKGADTFESDTGTTPEIKSSWELADDYAKDLRDTAKALKYVPIIVGAVAAVALVVVIAKSRKD